MLPNHPLLMGIVNVTPDSFSDGGRYLSTTRAVEHALKLVEEGAYILDIGGESTRPGARPVAAAEEQDRILPVLEALQENKCLALISVDTRNASTMRAALKAGAGMINDVSALRHDADSIGVIRESRCLVALMHMQGEPATMQDDPVYTEIIQDISTFLSERIAACVEQGVARERIIADPGIGFGKTLEHNLDLLRSLSCFKTLGVPLLLGASRKGFIARLDEKGAADRLAGSIACALHGLRHGVKIFRVHDVAATRQAFAVWQSVQQT